MFAGCYIKETKTNITYKDLTNNIVHIDMNKSVKEIANTIENIENTNM